MHKKIISLCLVLVFLLSPTLSAFADGTTISPMPDAIKIEKTASWKNGVRRFGIISLGIFPFMIFYTRVGFDVARYIQNDFDVYYAPWPLKTNNSYDPTDSEQLTSIGVAALFSITFAAIDSYIVWRKDNKNE